MKLVIIECPYSGDIAGNMIYARACMRHSLSLGEAPFASHLLYAQPHILRDDIADERGLGIAAGLAWARTADAMVVYDDLGISPGMVAGIEDAKKHGRPVEYRKLPEEFVLDLGVNRRNEHSCTFFWDENFVVVADQRDFLNYAHADHIAVQFRRQPAQEKNATTILPAYCDMDGAR
jgi:hypothetical protein